MTGTDSAGVDLVTGLSPLASFIFHGKIAFENSACLICEREPELLPAFIPCLIGVRRDRGVFSSIMALPTMYILGKFQDYL